MARYAACVSALLLTGVLTACACNAPALPPATEPAEEIHPPVESADVTLTPDGDGIFRLSGPYGLEGTIGREDNGPVRLDATFHFPTGGYTLGDVKTIMLKRLPEHIIFTIPLTAPAPDAVVTQAIDTQSVQAEVTATDGATFEVDIAMTEPSPGATP